MAFQFIAGNLALDFANTVHSVGLDDPQDDLKTYADFLLWSREAGLVDRRELRRGSEKGHSHAADLAHLKDLRSVLYQLFSSIAAYGEPPAAFVRQFNSCLHAAMAEATLKKAGDNYRLASESRTLPERASFEITRAAMELLTSGRLDRVRQCSGETCTWLFLDTSRNGMRRWCEMQACGNRAKIRRFRERLYA